METVDILIVFRGAERLFVTLGGLVCLVMGTLLYKWGVFDKADVQAQGHGWKLTLKNASPGVVFAIIGGILLGISISNGMNIESVYDDLGKIEVKRISYAAPAGAIQGFLERCRDITEAIPKHEATALSLEASNLLQLLDTLPTPGD